MMEVECPAVTPEVVLKASGHVDRFNDLMTRDAKTQDCYRADHLLKGAGGGGNGESLEGAKKLGSFGGIFSKFCCVCACALTRVPVPPPRAAHLEAMQTDPLLSGAAREEVADALARLDELKAADMDAAFAKFGVKARRAAPRRSTPVGRAPPSHRRPRRTSHHITSRHILTHHAACITRRRRRRRTR